MKFIKKIPIKNNTKKTELKVLYYEQSAKNTRTPKHPKPITKKKDLAPKGSKVSVIPSAFRIPAAACNAA